MLLNPDLELWEVLVPHSHHGFVGITTRPFIGMLTDLVIYLHEEVVAAFNDNRSIVVKATKSEFPPNLRILSTSNNAGIWVIVYA